MNSSPLCFASNSTSHPLGIVTVLGLVLGLVGSETQITRKLCSNYTVFIITVLTGSLCEGRRRVCEGGREGGRVRVGV